MEMNFSGNSGGELEFMEEKVKISYSIVLKKLMGKKKIYYCVMVIEVMLNK